MASNCLARLTIACLSGVVSFQLLTKLVLADHQSREVRIQHPSEYRIETRYREEIINHPAEYRIETRYRTEIINHPAEYRIETRYRNIGGKAIPYQEKVLVKQAWVETKQIPYQERTLVRQAWTERRKVPYQEKVLVKEAWTETKLVPIPHADLEKSRSSVGGSLSRTDEELLRKDIQTRLQRLEQARQITLTDGRALMEIHWMGSKSKQLWSEGVAYLEKARDQMIIARSHLIGGYVEAFRNNRDQGLSFQRVAREKLSAAYRQARQDTERYAQEFLWPFGQAKPDVRRRQTPTPPFGSVPPFDSLEKALDHVKEVEDRALKALHGIPE